jgi:pyrroline-5-carboxylate reductase
MLNCGKLGVIGAGKMGQAIVAGVLRSGLLTADRIVLSDPRSEVLDDLRRQWEVTTTGDNSTLLATCDLILIAVKPQNFDELWAQTRGHFNVDHCVISVAAGVSTQSIENALGLALPVVRIMPNTPALVGQGMSAFCLGRYAEATHAALCTQLFATVGQVVQVEESLMNAVTAVSGSGPAYLFALAEAMQSGAQQLGLSAEQAQLLVQQTLLGASTLLAQSNDSAATLRQNVTSPGGTTAAALEVLKDGQFEGLMERALKAASDRAQELGRA